jgi:hypothetical protein
MNFAQLIRSSGIEKNALGGGGFARVNMRHYAYISCFLQRISPGH